MDNITADDFKEFCIPYAPSPLDAYRGRGIDARRKKVSELCCKCSHPRCQAKLKDAEDRQKQLDGILSAWIKWSQSVGK